MGISIFLGILLLFSGREAGASLPEKSNLKKILRIYTLPNLPSLENEGEVIQVKGFLVESQVGKWLLATQPNIRTCCLDNPEKSGPIVYLEGDFLKEAKGKIKVVEGKLLVEGKKEGGEKFFLEGAQVISSFDKEKEFIFPYQTLYVLGVLGAAMVAMRILRKKLH